MTATRLTNWPDTHNDPAPSDHLYKSATWLLGRHPMLAELAARAKVVYVDDDDREVSIDLYRLVDGLNLLEQTQAEREVYWKPYREGSPEAVYDQWCAGEPKFPDTDAGRTAKAIAPMSGSEKTRLRLLATFAHPGSRIAVSDFGRLDDNGQRLLADWMTAARCA